MLTDLKFLIKTERIHPHTQETQSQTLCGWTNSGEACAFARQYKKKHGVTTVVYDADGKEIARYTQKPKSAIFAEKNL